MVEVFKTGVTERSQAKMLADQIHRSFAGYKANFDLEDCDKILRVKCTDNSRFFFVSCELSVVSD